MHSEEYSQVPLLTTKKELSSRETGLRLTTRSPGSRVALAPLACPG
jgi:hypothetical protein